MLTLHLGVVDQPYRFAAPIKGFKSTKYLKQRRGGVHSAMTTYEVAKILEDKYGVMATFWRVKERENMESLERSLESAMQSLFNGHAIDPWGPFTQDVMQRFRDFINSGEAERVGIPGTPTDASGGGKRVGAINHRLKHPYAKRNERRPSFRDTGLYVASFRCWVD